jgi:hypothetical protein
MLKALMIVLGIALLLVANSFGFSKNPLPKIQPPSNQSAAPGASDQRGTDQVPLTVKILPTQGANEKADKEDIERKEKAIIDKKLAFETQRIADYTFWLSKFTLFLFCVAVLQAGLFVWQLLYMRKGLRDATIATNAATASAKAANDSILLAKQTAEQQLRAYVFPTKIGVKLYIGQVPKYCVLIRNTGQTPAYKLRCIDRFASVNFPLQEPLPDTVSSDFSRTNLGPGHKLEKSGTARRPDDTPVIFTASALEKLRDGRAAIYVYGIIDFVDAFKRERWVKYRYMTGGNVGFQSDGKLVICEQGNDTSED